MGSEGHVHKWADMHVGKTLIYINKNKYDEQKDLGIQKFMPWPNRKHWKSIGRTLCVGSGLCLRMGRMLEA